MVREVAERAGHGSRRQRAKRFEAAVLLRLGRRWAVAVVVWGCGGTVLGPSYRPSKAVERAVGRWPWCGRPASLAGTINGVLAPCEHRGARHGRRGGAGVTGRERQRRAQGGAVRPKAVAQAARPRRAQGGAAVGRRSDGRHAAWPGTHAVRARAAGRSRPERGGAGRRGSREGRPGQACAAE